jgi:hypothetical protein
MMLCTAAITPKSQVLLPYIFGLPETVHLAKRRSFRVDDVSPPLSIFFHFLILSSMHTYLTPKTGMAIPYREHQCASNL